MNLQFIVLPQEAQQLLIELLIGVSNEWTLRSQPPFGSEIRDKSEERRLKMGYEKAQKDVSEAKLNQHLPAKLKRYLKEIASVPLIAFWSHYRTPDTEESFLNLLNEFYTQIKTEIREFEENRRLTREAKSRELMNEVLCEASAFFESIKSSAGWDWDKEKTVREHLSTALKGISN